MLKNIIFDFGGVILNINYQAAIESFKKLGLHNFEEQYSQLAQTHLFDNFETGKITPAQFREEIRKKISRPISDKEIDRAWDSMLLDLPKERVELLRKLKKTHRLFLLSNTNAIHEKSFRQSIIDVFGNDILDEVFEKVYLSHHIGMRKPNKETFHLVMKENNLDPKETVFIDDSPQHIEGAKAAGLDTIFLDKNKTILDLF